jgi:hypothetical protein
MKLEIITHCWRYSRVLNYHLSSLVLHPPTGVDVSLTLFYNPDDKPTVDVLKYFQTHHAEQIPITARPQPLPTLLRRVIGRNIASKATDADYVWYADCDHYFGENCLWTLSKLAPEFDDDMIYFPGTIQINKTHELGDEYARRAKVPSIYTVNPDHFMDERMRKAIGGIQIVTGDTARKRGYVDNPHFQKDVIKSALKWGMVYEDPEYRGKYGLNCGRGTPIVLPNLFRIRQLVHGRVDTLN